MYASSLKTQLCINIIRVGKTWKNERNKAVKDNPLSWILHLWLEGWWLVPLQIVCIQYQTEMNHRDHWKPHHQNCLPLSLAWNWDDDSLQPVPSRR